MVAGAQGERCNAHCPHLQSTVKQCYCTLFGQYIERLVVLGHVRHQSCLTDPDVKACESYSLGRLHVVDKFNAALVNEIITTILVLTGCGTPYVPTAAQPCPNH
jgi:hypothetical protein